MSGPKNPIFDDFAKIFNDAAGAAQAMREEFESMARSQSERFLGVLEVAKRDDLEALRQMMVKISDRVARLEDRLDALQNTPPATRKSAAKKARATKKATKKIKKAPRKKVAKTPPKTA